MKKVAITGSTGVVGRALLQLLVARGFEVRALVRGQPGRDLVEMYGAVAVDGDVLDRDSLRELVRECEWVFHVAGVNEMCVRDPSYMERVNVTGTENMVEACRAGGVGRLVHTSSAVTLGEAKGSVGNEDSVHRGWFLSEYERTKFAAEETVFAMVSDLEVVAVNPSSVQGPGRATGTGRMILDVVRGRIPFLVDADISLVDIDDCALGHLLVAEKGEPGNRYVLNGATVGVRAAVALAAAVVGEDLQPRFLHPTLVGALASVAEPLARRFGREIPFCREMMRVMAFGHHYDGSRARSELGLEYRPIEETIARTIHWFESEGLLN